MEKYRDIVDISFQNAESNFSKITSDIISMEGMSGTKTRHFYNNLLNNQDARYLEIGTWKGSSVCSAMCGNKAKVLCIDNWSEFGGPKDEFVKNFEKFKGENDARFIENDCYKVDISGLPKFNIYMYDGNHSEESHYRALNHYYDCLDDVFIFIVDDWNWQEVRNGTLQSIKKLNLNVLYQKEIRLTMDNSVTLEPLLSKTWWNGIYVAILQKNNHASLKINYKLNKSILCELGRIYDTDKSSARDRADDYRHCHPYTLFYEGLFRNKKDSSLKIAELGILDGGSLRMWQDYFTQSEIYGFDYNQQFITNFKSSFNNDRITLNTIDVTNKDNIIKTFQLVNIMYDIILDDTTHKFEDQIRVIENTYQYLKPGGILIIEDVFKSYNEQDYIIRLQHILKYFQDYYFIELDHVNRISTGWDNDKLFILIKGGAEPIFKNTNKLTIITPSYRINNLLQVKQSINFNYIDQWIIVYDGSRVTENPNLFQGQENGKIKEYIYKGEGISGNPQRNYALTTVSNPDTLIYYLDDDNLLHPDIYKLLNIIDSTKLYTFNQYNRLKGNNISVCNIDTAMCIIPYTMCKNLKWIPDKYDADGYFIQHCHLDNQKSHIYVDNNLCYYNKI
jgi:predicted O-methyltransferase YrrM